MLGKFIVIEGTDGSGKTEQFKLLSSRLEAADEFARPPKRDERGFDAGGRWKIQLAKSDFPQYGKPSAYFAEQYLNGKYGTAEAVGPERASMFYALDRYEASFELRKALEEGKTVVSNRYVGSNLAHQGGKIKDNAARKIFFEWGYKLEYETLGIPKPDVSIVLHMPAAVAQELVLKKGERAYLHGAKQDIHEADLKHLERAEETYLEMVRLFPKDFILVECVENGKLLTIEEIHEKVWEIVSKVINVK
ncbi:MAG: deoxynucleoside kinase [Patescibacteria group bacterium]|nr:deoxynucleoside kinase [Patescibacteria group bacterium]